MKKYGDLKQGDFVYDIDLNRFVQIWRIGSKRMLGYDLKDSRPIQYPHDMALYVGYPQSKREIVFQDPLPSLFGEPMQRILNDHQVPLTIRSKVKGVIMLESVTALEKRVEDL